MKLLRDPNSWLETAGVGIVSKLAGDADYVFKSCDLNGDGQIDTHELKKLFERLDCEISDRELASVFNELDTDGDGLVGLYVGFPRVVLGSFPIFLLVGMLSSFL